MEDKKYRVKILPLFEDDLDNAVDYISKKLKNPNAALRLIDSVQSAIEKRALQAESFEPFHSAKERRYLYYRIYVKNYIVFYVVIDDIMEVRRLLYNQKKYKDDL